MSDFENEILIKLLKIKAEELKDDFNSISIECNKLMEKIIALESII